MKKEIKKIKKVRKETLKVCEHFYSSGIDQQCYFFIKRKENLKQTICYMPI